MAGEKTYEWRHFDKHSRDDDWEEVLAFDAWDAVRKGADCWDNEDRHMIRSSEPHEFEVRDEDGVVTRWLVWGEAQPYYYASPA